MVADLWFNKNSWSLSRPSTIFQISAWVLSRQSTIFQKTAGVFPGHATVFRKTAGVFSHTPSVFRKMAWVFPLFFSELRFLRQNQVLFRFYFPIKPICQKQEIMPAFTSTNFLIIRFMTFTLFGECNKRIMNYKL